MINLPERPQVTLAECEATIARTEGAAVALAVEQGRAWRAIRDGRLYQTTSFDDYCRERWDRRREAVDRIIRVAAVAEALGPDRPLPSLAAAEPLMPLEPDDMRARYDEVAATGPVTRKALETKRSRLMDDDGTGDMHATLGKVVARASRDDDYARIIVEQVMEANPQVREQVEEQVEARLEAQGEELIKEVRQHKKADEAARVQHKERSDEAMLMMHLDEYAEKARDGSRDAYNTLLKVRDFVVTTLMEVGEMYE